MKLRSFAAIVTALNDANTRYLVVGGLAVNAHGYLRYTRDVDIVIQLSPANILAVFEALARIDYHPGVPISATQFADAALREKWRLEKGMLALKFWSDSHQETPLDVFIYEPFDFSVEESAAFRPNDPGSPTVGFASIPALIAMKRIAARPQDLTDIEKLEEIADIRDRDRSGDEH